MAGAREQKAHKRLLVVTWLALYYLAGLPIWWHLTSIHRPALPFEQMLAADASGAAGRQRSSSTGLGLSRGVLSFSLCNADPSSGIYSWDFDALHRWYLQPAVAALQPLMSLTLQSQVLYYTTAQVNGTWSDKHQAFVIAFEDLPFFLDRSWAPDAGQLGVGTDGGGQRLALSWMVWVPPPAQRPLRVLLPSGELSPTDSYVIPSWGGVVIYNPAAAASADRSNRLGQPSTRMLMPEQLRGVFSIVLAQLRQHLGLPDGPDSAGSCPLPAGPVADGSDNSVKSFGGNSSGSCATGISIEGQATDSCSAHAPLSSADVGSLIEQALAANLAAAGSTLASLARLVQGLPSLEMPDLVGDQVQRALAAREQAFQHADAGSLQAAVAASQRATETAEAAFFHHSILAQLSFPAQHKLAVYLPFFLPATLPIIVGLLREARRALGRKNELAT